MIRSTLVFSAISILSFALGNHLAIAQESTTKSQTQLELQQSYQGTTPGAGNKLPKIVELKNKKDGNWITWPGFIPSESGASQLFLQTTSPLEFTQNTQPLKITLSFKNTRIFLGNNQNPLITTHFKTPLKRAYLKNQGKNAALIMELKKAVDIKIQQISSPDGYHYLFVDFPAL